jgi:hypothetical protein
MANAEESRDATVPQVDYASDLQRIFDASKVTSPTSASAESMLQGADELDNVAWVDFTEVRFFLDEIPAPTSQEGAQCQLTSDEKAFLKEVQTRDGEAQAYGDQFYQPFKNAIARGVWENLHYAMRSSPWRIASEDPETGRIIAIQIEWKNYFPYEQQYYYDVPTVVNGLLNGLLTTDLADISDLFFSLDALSPQQRSLMRTRFFERVATHCAGGLSDPFNMWRLYSTLCSAWDGGMLDLIPTLWLSLKDKLFMEFGEVIVEDAYTFEAPIVGPDFDFLTFGTNTVNLGLRLVYRQEWRPLGTQRGEVVRTIPLGPKQSEKVSTKLVRRIKTTRTSESLKSTETSTERSDTAKDSSEIVSEAASSMKWNLNQEVEGGYNCGVWKVGGSTSFGYGEESSESSKQTSSHLSETMSKTASKVRTETKLIVSTESEETYEATSASEIQNPNDEIAVTYVYSKLQRGYEILTRLAEVQDVIMVAEEIPKPGDIDFDWVKRHDWVLAKVLLDDSFRDALSSISQEVAQPSMDGLTTDLRGARDKTLGSLDKFAERSAITAQNIDFAGESQKTYNASLKERLESLRQNFLLEAKRYRLYEHIRENILHYYRAIWQHEDPQHRMLRYRKYNLRFPLNWQFQPDDTSYSIEDFTRPDAVMGIPGTFTADWGGPTIPLTDLINPAGPIAFYGNYAMYYLRPEYAGKNAVMDLLKVFKSPYIYRGELMDPVEQRFMRECEPATVSEATLDQCREEMIAYLPQLQVLYQKAKEEVEKGTDPNALEDFQKGYHILRESFGEYLLMKVSHIEIQEDMIDRVPTLKLHYLKAKGRTNRGEDPAALKTFLKDYDTFKRFYAEYLFRKEQSRRFLVDTNCLMIDILPGEGSALEPFKQIHRAMDIVKVDRECVKMQLENTRRTRLIADERYEDPDIEKLTVITSDVTRLGSIVAGVESAAGHETDEETGSEE